MNNGGPAFPINFEAFKEGMTLRDYFAAKAMQGILASPAFFGPFFQQSPIAAAEFAMLCADAMLEERA